MIRVENILKIEWEAGNGRRDFLKGMLGAGAFVLGVSLMPKQLFSENTGTAAGNPFPPSEKAPLQPSVYLAIGTDGTVYVIAHRSEMGNGVRTSLPRIVADELDAD
jgi:isoquinoline 1-oxidoreductase beta subunit